MPTSDPPSAIVVAQPEDAAAIELRPSSKMAPVSADLQKIDRQVAESIQASVSDNTLRAYVTQYRQYEEWCKAAGLPSMPAAPEIVARYAQALATAGRKISTIKLAVAAIAFRHRHAGHVWDERNVVLASTLRGLRRTLGVRPEKKAPVLAGTLRNNMSNGDHGITELRDKALLLFGWAGAYRRSEIVSFDVADLTWKDDGIIALLRRSKVDQEAAGMEKGIPYANNPATCPVRALRAWVDAAGIKDGPLFRRIRSGGHVTEERLSAAFVATIVKKFLADRGVDPSRYAGHSLRSGFATSAAENGATLEEIMRQTGHKTEAVAMGYIRHANLLKKNPGSGLL
jgi:integrase